MKLQKFDAVIYPRKLWVAISKSGTELNGTFRHEATCEIIRFEEYGLAGFYAITFPVVEVSSNHVGVLIIYTKQGNMTCSTVAHEAVHAAGLIFQGVRAQIDSDEAFAYLVGWVADCCWRLKNGKAR
jgi:hypothetical protein